MTDLCHIVEIVIYMIITGSDNFLGCQDRTFVGMAYA